MRPRTIRRSSPEHAIEDHYQALGVAETATTDQVKKAFRALAREVHPDVAGEDPAVVERFKQIRLAYEVLVDPKSRQRYDRRRAGPTRPPPGRFGFQSSNFTARQTNTSHTQSRSDMDLEDIFSDHGGILDFGFGGAPSKSGGAPSSPRPGREVPPRKQPGGDVVLAVELAPELADAGGTIRLDYSRLVRQDDGQAVKRVEEVHHLRVAPDTEHGQTLRVPRMGDAGLHGGNYGDLVCDVHVTAESAARSKPSPAGTGSTSRATGEPMVVPISIAECVLGGAVSIRTPQGPVRVGVPPCTAGGARLRLRGKGELGADGQPTDLVVQLRVVPPGLVDEESRELIARFAALNPQGPRD